MGKLLLIFRTIHCSHVHVEDRRNWLGVSWVLYNNVHLFFLSLFLFIVIVRLLCKRLQPLGLIFRNIREEEGYREFQCKYVKRQDSDLWPVTTLNKVLKSRPSITHRFLSTVRGFPALSPPRKNPTRWILMQFALVPWKTSSTLRRVARFCFERVSSISASNR